MSKTLIIYYSRRGQNYVNGQIESLPKGNTEITAEYIQQAVGADLFEVQTKKHYADDYYQCIDEAKQELLDKVFPELIQILDSVADYDNIVVAGPCWWGTYPMAIFTQLKNLDFVGKKVFPVMSHEGSGLAGSTTALKKYCTGASVGEGLSIHGADTVQSELKIKEWAKRNLAE